MVARRHRRRRPGGHERSDGAAGVDGSAIGGGRIIRTAIAAPPGRRNRPIGAELAENRGKRHRPGCCRPGWPRRRRRAARSAGPGIAAGVREGGTPRGVYCAAPAATAWQTEADCVVDGRSTVVDAIDVLALAVAALRTPRRGVCA